MLDAKNVDSKLSADIQFANAFPDPAFRHFHLKNGVLIVLMYMGRVAGLTLIYAAVSGKRAGAAKLPLDKITVG